MASIAACTRALVDGQAKARSSGGRRKGSVSLAAFVRGYLSRRHRDSPATGCAIAALLSDVARADLESWRVMEQHIEAFIARTAVEDAEADDSDAILNAVRDFVVTDARC